MPAIGLNIIIKRFIYLGTKKLLEIAFLINVATTWDIRGVVNLKKVNLWYGNEGIEIKKNARLTSKWDHPKKLQSAWFIWNK